jgi:hypothetical protein
MLFSSRLSLLLVTALLLPLLTTGQDEKAEKPARPLVTKIGENSYRLGEILFDSKEKKIEIPVVVNMNEGGPIEYLLVNENGKVHEAIFTTTISPSELQIVLKLLKFESGHGDVFNRLLAPEVLDKEGGTEAERGDAMEFLFVEDASSSSMERTPNPCPRGTGSIPDRRSRRATFSPKVRDPSSRSISITSPCST